MKNQLDKALLKSYNMTFFVDISDYGKSLQADLGISENDNCILMTYKLVINKKDCLDWECEQFEAWHMDWHIDAAMQELDCLLKNDKPLKIMSTVEKAKERIDNNEKLQYLLYVLVNMRNLDISVIQNSLKPNINDYFYGAKFYSVAITSMEQIAAIPSETWCLSPVNNIKDTIDLIRTQSKKGSEQLLLKYDYCE